ncbi:MAG: hypothetical protein M3280_07940 [Actinomycetota bacterium]|nr:hypothetical protein [Actinomycetota bacterium]
MRRTKLNASTAPTGRSSWKNVIFMTALLSIVGLSAQLLPATASVRHRRQADYCTSGGAIRATSLPDRVSLEKCDIADRLIVSGSVGLRVPPPGHGISGTAVGNPETHLAVSTSLDGVVSVHEGFESHEAQVSVGGAPEEPCDKYSLPGTCLAPCDDTNYSTLDPSANPEVKTSQNYKFKSSTTPGSMTVDQAIQQIKAGTKNIVTARNSCGRPDVVGPTSAYKGTSSTGAQVYIDTGGPGAGDDIHRCRGVGQSDGQNRVDFGKLVAPTVGLACTWWTSTDGVHWFIASADIRLKKTAPWTLTPDAAGCSNLIDIQGVMTHERGHAFGLGHTTFVASPNEYTHANQTMFPATFSCTSYARTLGKGDHTGLNFLY